MLKKYKVTSVGIEKIICERETENYVTVGGQKLAKRAKYWNFFDTLKEARAFKKEKKPTGHIYIRINNNKVRYTSPTQAKNCMVNVDFDRNNNVVGIEIIGPFRVSIN